ncbi:MAG: hypothetical protein R3A13_04760 [Bdellovibrionota bacterium]
MIDTHDHVSALRKLEDRNFTHVIFDIQDTLMTSRDFLISILEHDQTIIPIPSSYEPTVDDVFDLLIVGARGFWSNPTIHLH